VTFEDSKKEKKEENKGSTGLSATKESTRSRKVRSVPNQKSVWKKNWGPSGRKEAYGDG